MMKLVDEMESAGKKLDPEEFTSYVLAGLDMDYNFVVSSITACVESITCSELLSHMLSHELHLEILQGVMDINLLQILPCVDVVDMVAAVDVVVEILLVHVVAAMTSLVDAVVATTTSPNVISVARLATWFSSAGKDLITPSMVNRSLQMLLVLVPMESTQIGTLTPVEPTTSQATLIS
jgi:hypothetical protein